MKNRILVISLVVLLATSSVVVAGCPPPPVVEPEPFPTKPILNVISFAVGGGTDQFRRIMAPVAIDHYGQPWRLVNMPGASGLVAWKHILDLPADGYTMLHTSGPPIFALAAEKVPPLTLDDIRVVAVIAEPQILSLAAPGAPWATWETFIAYVKENPGELSIGGVLSLKVAMRFVLEQVGVADKVVFVPYASTGDAVTDFLGGHIHIVMVSVGTAIGLVPDSAVALISVSDQPLTPPALADVPRAIDFGLEGFAEMRWIGIHPDTPEEIIRFHSDKIGAMLKEESVVKLLGAVGKDVHFTPFPEAEERVRRFKERVIELVR